MYIYIYIYSSATQGPPLRAAAPGRRRGDLRPGSLRDVADVYTCMHTSMYVYVYTYIYMYLSLYISLSLYIYIYIYTHIHIYILRDVNKITY